MTFHLIGLGLGPNSINLSSLEKIKNCNRVYLESYTIDFPYKKSDLEKILGIKLIQLPRESVENEDILKESSKEDIALLVYGDPFSATTHHQLILSCKKQGIPFEIEHNASIINSIAESGLSLYKFGKVSSMPSWKNKYRPSSFLDYVIENKSIKSHSLILIDIGLSYLDAINQLEIAAEEKNLKLDKILVCSRIGTFDKSFYFDNLKNLKLIKEVFLPFCFVIPSDLHFIELELLDNL